MYPRLRLLREFLREDGAIFVSIDDNEIDHLKLICDEIFGSNNFVSTIIWNMIDSPKNSAIQFSGNHEYIVVYAKDSNIWRPNSIPRTDEMNARYRNRDNDPRGPWLLGDLAARNFYAAGRYKITTPSGRVISGPPSGSYWRVSEEKFRELEEDKRIYWGEKGSNRPGIKRFLSEVKEGVVPQTFWSWKEAGSNRHSKQELSALLNLGASSDIFTTPKPVKLISRLLTIATNADDLILDSFAGSGTTAQAVLASNEQDGGSRNFILVELEKQIAQDVTSERLRRVINGYNKGGDPAKPVEGLGGGFRYCTLGKSLFDEYGGVDPEIKITSLAAHVFFIETGSPIPKRANGKTPLLGTFEDRAIYLLFNANSAGFAQNDSGNVLTPEFLESLPLPFKNFEGTRVVYGEGCTVDAARLEREGVVFKQIPYSIGG